MPRRDLSTADASSQAASELSSVISKTKPAESSAVPTLTPEEAMGGERVFTRSSDRDVTRVLFISQNAGLLNPTKQTLDGYINLSDLFDEVHILLLRTGIVPRQPVLRVDENVWIYTAAAKHWWQKPRAGTRLAQSQLVFAEGFRPDLIVARDPFESAVVAERLHRRYQKPMQLHVLANSRPLSWLHSKLPQFLIPKFSSIRTATDQLQQSLQKKYPGITDIATLPRFQNYESLITVAPTINLTEKYKPFVFVMLYVGKLGHDSTLFRALDAARFALRNPRVGMVVVGAGPARSEFQKRAKQLDIDQQVVFEKSVKDIVPYLKSANVLLVTDTDAASEELTLQAAAAGIPMVLAQTQLRADRFVHEESALLCPPTDIQAFSDNITDIMNNIALRKTLVSGAQDMITQKFHQDPQQYHEAYRHTIEQALFVGQGSTNKR